MTRRQPTNSILTLTTSCISKLKQLLAPQNQLPTEILECRLADLRLWADGVGALAKPGASLDTRLRGRQNDIALVKNVLSMLANSLDHLATLPAISADFERGIQNLDSSIRNLALIGVAIRRTGKASRSRKTDSTFNPDEYREFKEYLVCMALLRPRAEGQFEATDDGRYISKLNINKTSELQKRLINANLRRRHAFILAQKRSGVQPAMTTQNSSLITDPEIALRSAPLAKAEMHVTESMDPAQIPRVKEKGSASTISGQTYASTLEGSLNYNPTSKKYTPGAAKTFITVIASDADFPQPPATDSGREISRCPCCCQSLPIETFINPKKWK